MGQPRKHDDSSSPSTAEGQALRSSEGEGSATEAESSKRPLTPTNAKETDDSDRLHQSTTSGETTPSRSTSRSHTKSSDSSLSSTSAQSPLETDRHQPQRRRRVSVPSGLRRQDEDEGDASSTTDQLVGGGDGDDLNQGSGTSSSAQNTSSEDPPLQQPGGKNRRPSATSRLLDSMSQSLSSLQAHSPKPRRKNSLRDIIGGGQNSFSNLSATDSPAKQQKKSIGAASSGETPTASPSRRVRLIPPAEYFLRSHSLASIETLDSHNSLAAAEKEERKQRKALEKQRSESELPQQLPLSPDLDTEENSSKSLKLTKRQGSERTAKTAIIGSTLSMTYVHNDGEDDGDDGKINDDARPLKNSLDRGDEDHQSYWTEAAVFKEVNPSNQSDAGSNSIDVIRSTGATGSIDDMILDTLDEDENEDDDIEDLKGDNQGNSAEKFPAEKVEEDEPLSAWHSFLINVTTFRDFCGELVNNPYVQIGIIILILVNAIMMGIATFGFVDNNPPVARGFELADRAFLIIFTVELGLQFIYRGLSLFVDGWLLFDLIIVVLSWSLESLQIVRAFRVFRAFRLITRLEVLKNLVLALFAVAPSMGAIIALLCLILYIYAVLCTEMFRSLYAEGYTELDYFGRLDNSLFTLFQMVTLEWADICRQVMVRYYWIGYFVFTSFLVFTSFILYSLIIAVVCDSVNVTEHQEEMEAHVQEKEESRQRIYALEQRVSDLTQQQLIILESLQTSLRQLETKPIIAPDSISGGSSDGGLRDNNILVFEGEDGSGKHYVPNGMDSTDLTKGSSADETRGRHQRSKGSDRSTGSSSDEGKSRARPNRRSDSHAVS